MGILVLASDWSNVAAPNLMASSIWHVNKRSWLEDCQDRDIVLLWIQLFIRHVQVISLLQSWIAGATWNLWRSSTSLDHQSPRR